MSDFKTQINSDLSDVFFSDLEEFWETLTIKTGTGTSATTLSVKGIFDNDELLRKEVKKVYQESAQKISNDKKLLMCMESELTAPRVNSKIVINSTTYTVIDVDSQMGLLVIQLERYTQGRTNGTV